MTEEIKHHLFYSNESVHCQNLLKLIKKNEATQCYNYYNIDDAVVRAKLPASITKVPTLIVKGIKKPLIGKEVFNWIETQQYINLTSNNINKVSNPDFYVDPTIGKAHSTNLAAIEDCDDKKMNTNITYVEDFDKIRVTADMNKRYIDRKINENIQKQKLDELIQTRNNDLLNILDTNKEF